MTKWQFWYFYYLKLDSVQALRNIIAPAAHMVRQQSSLDYYAGVRV